LLIWQEELNGKLTISKKMERVMKKLPFLFLSVCYIALTLGCSPTISGNLRKDLMFHNFPAPPVEIPIVNPIILKLEEGITKKVRGNCEVIAIIEHIDGKPDMKRFELSGTLFLENITVRVAEAVSYDIYFRIKEALVNANNQQVQITKYNITELFKKDDLKKVFDQYNIKMVLNKSTKEISAEFMGEKEITKEEDSIIWGSFDKDYKESPPLKTGDKLFTITKESFPIKTEHMEIESLISEEEIKGITNIFGKKYLSTQLTLRGVLKVYDEKTKEYHNLEIKGGGYKLYEIPNLCSSKFVATFFIDSKEMKIAFGISFDGDLTTPAQVHSLITDHVSGARGQAAAIATAKETARDGRFIAYSNGTVLDTRTNLMWAAKDNGSDINRADAKNYCENYRGGGYTDWRMPTQNELAGLYDAGKTNKNPPSGGCQGNYHLTELIHITCCCPWASETRGSEAAKFFFDNGERYWYPQSFGNGNRALPVRSGK
jgi:hypothetical protein